MALLRRNGFNQCPDTNLRRSGPAEHGYRNQSTMALIAVGPALGAVECCRICELGDNPLESTFILKLRHVQPIPEVDVLVGDPSHQPRYQSRGASAGMGTRLGPPLAPGEWRLS